MITNKIMNCVIIVLVMAAVCQTGMLWLDDTTSHNIFYSVFNSHYNEYFRFSGETYPLEPKEMVVGYGNKKFSLLYSDTENETLSTQGNDAITEALQKGIFSYETALDWTEVLNYKCLVYRYYDTISMPAFLSGFNINKSEISSKVQAFDSIVIYPLRATGEYLRVSFIDEQKEKVYVYSLQKSRVADGLYNSLEEQGRNENGSIPPLVYISTKQSGFHIFNQNTFVPQWTTGSSYPYVPLQKKSPFETDGVISQSQMEKNTENFFGSYAPQWSEVDNGTSILSNNNIVVKYFKGGVLEYYNYAILDEDQNQNLATAYSACKSFLKSDSTLETAYYLENVKPGPNEITFYFNYAVDNFPVLLSEAQGIQTELNACFEVTVKNNAVIKYRRYAYNFAKTTSGQDYVDVDFLKVLDTIILGSNFEQASPQEIDINRIHLVYYADFSDSLRLKWIASINGQSFLADIKKS